MAGGDTMTATTSVTRALGGQRVFKGRGTPTATELRDRVRAGLPYESLESIRERLRLTLPEIAVLLHVPLRTLARRRHGGRLDADESDRLYRVARIAARAVDVLNTDERVATWLRRPNRALNGEPPLALLDTDLGARQIEDVLGRLEYGVVG
jgi:putative toxin-antitoxin system antitoxin component (TIGR02293 family)